MAKVPLDPRSGLRADVTNLRHCVGFDEICRYHDARRGSVGVGFVLHLDDGFVGIDLDGCVADGVVSSQAGAIIAEFGSYAEISPSGRGVKLVVRGTKPTGRSRVRGRAGMSGIEMYSWGRFFTITGNHVPTTPIDVVDAQSAIDGLCREFLPEVRRTEPDRSFAIALGDGDDETLLDRMSRAKNGAKFRSLWAGSTEGHGGDRSAADLALCRILAFWTDDPRRIDRLFRRSGLMRPKWDSPRAGSTYGRITIAKAIDGPERRDGDQVRRTSRSGPRGSPPLASEVSPRGGVPGSPAGPVLSTTRVTPSAIGYLASHHLHSERATLLAHGAEFHEWRGNRWRPVADAQVRAGVQRWLDGAWCATRGGGVVRFPTNPRNVNAVVETLRNHEHVDGGLSPPAWLDGGGAGRPPAHLVVPCLSSNIDIESGMTFARTPLLFNTCALDFDLDPGAAEPTAWFSFLRSVFGDDEESIQLLQEWFGYSLVQDNSLQKILLMVGASRGGKGVIAEVLRSLVGAENVVHPTPAVLAGTFGKQCLVGKSLAIMSDARFVGRDAGILVGDLLAISGGGPITIESKYRDQVTTTLGVRFVIIANELPTLPDASGAIASRFLLLSFTESFAGREDVTLTERLLKERPGILLWALEGSRRLRTRRAFVQPASGQQLLSALRAASSPIDAFLSDCCIDEPTGRVTVPDLWRSWVAWCRTFGRVETGNVQAFSKGLLAARPKLRARRGTDDVRFYAGIRLACEADRPKAPPRPSR